jgi:hypothetical protein
MAVLLVFMLPVQTFADHEVDVLFFVAMRTKT